ncbi:MAG: hypothetical protein HY075_11320 [Deltaproteobacteria bacterium]|nr:hypothetical protein [Deltaproteobacteria bacterium]
MFQKRKKFQEETTPEQRLADRWAQQVFFITRKFPQAKRQIATIEKEFTPKRKAGEFEPTEEALQELTNLYADLQSQGPALSI